jgi:cardiolipin synthase
MRALFGHTWRRLEGPELPRRTLTPSSARGDGRVAVLANFYLDGRRTVRGEYLRRIRAAREHILIANSYFLPDRQIRRALVAAVSRGVNVKVLVPGRSDVLAIYYASRRLYPWLLAQGIQIWEWRRTVLHSKTAVIDKSWCTVGTYNLDHRSWRFNLEVNVAVEDAAVGERMHLRFLADLALAVRVDAREFSMRSLTERLIEHFCYFFRKLL